METGILVRLFVAALLALAGLVVAARGQFEVALRADQLGGLIFLGGLFWAYRQVKAHFDAADRGEE